jgi:2-dehydro-3-deoxyphosphooctonate aldolase (KDO 8-P synthase)
MATEMDISKLSLIERGTCFGYGDLVVDMRGLKIMNDLGTKVIFDITHSTQQPSGANPTTAGAREFAGLLARSAVATGYVSGIFIETHPSPAQAWSDADVQLSFTQSRELLENLAPIWKIRKNLAGVDAIFSKK